jgi:cell division septum initiation protein DivIVA
MIKARAIGLLALLLLLAVAGAASLRMADSEPWFQPFASDATPARSALTQALWRDELASRQQAGEALDPRRVAHTVQMHLRVADPRAESAAIEGLLSDYGGFVESGEVRDNGSQERHYAELVLRVPTHNVAALMADLRARADRVLHEKRRAADVTEQHVDLEARLRNLRHAEQEMRALMTSVRERGNDVDMLLRAHRELTQLRNQIEQIQAQIKHLQDRVAMATVQVSLLGPATPAVVADLDWRAMNAARQAVRDLVRGLQLLATITIYLLIAVLPMMLILLGPVVAVLVLNRRRRSFRAL